MTQQMDKTLSEPVARPPRLMSSPARLRQVYPAGGLSADLSMQELEFGREASDERHRIDHPTVSKRHLAVAWEPHNQRHVVRDLGSHNGSALNGDPLGAEPQPLSDNAVLRMGSTLFVYEIGLGLKAADAPEVSREALPGEAPSVRALRGQLTRIGPDPSPVLLTGETGTGKEWLARELHRLSGRSGPFLAVNCAAFTAELVESELFGHAKGAFTGASGVQPGFFRAAQGGTLFLDEVGELSLGMQPKLLRALQEGEVQPVGQSSLLKVDVRVIAATHRPLADAVEVGAFRRDLYARLCLWELRLPALRERRGDVLAWLERLSRKFFEERNLPGELKLDADTAEAVLLSSLPGNLRDLMRLVHQLSPGSEPVALWQLPGWLLETSDSSPEGWTAGSTAGESKRRQLPTPDEFRAAYRAHGGSVHALAKYYGRDRRQIYRWIAQHQPTKS